LENSDVNIMLKNIIGDDNYNNLIKELGYYFLEEPSCNLNNTIEDIEPILDYCCTAILLIGISKKPVNIDKYRIKLDDTREIIVDTQEFCNKFENYLQKVERFKFDLLKKIN